MASDQQVSSKVILAVMMELKRQGSRPALEHLEQVEPDLASYVMETSSLIYQRLMGMGAPMASSSRTAEVETITTSAGSRSARATVSMLSTQYGDHVLLHGGADSRDARTLPTRRRAEVA